MGASPFRLLAPKATEVRLNGQWPDGTNVAMTKDDNGVWSVTAGPLKPELWMYSFTVDGARAIDPRNVNTARDGANYLSTFFIDGPGAAPYRVTTSPRIAQHRLVRVAVAEADAPRFVYTPPGYRSGTARYPVLYLLHGGGGDEEAWTKHGPRTESSTTSSPRARRSR